MSEAGGVAGECPQAFKEAFKHVVPGLMPARQVCPSQPLKGLNMEVSLHVTIQTRVLMDTFVALGAKVRWASYSTFSTHAGISTFLRGKERPCLNIWCYTEKVMTGPRADGCHQLKDVGVAASPTCSGAEPSTLPWVLPERRTRYL